MKNGTRNAALGVTTGYQSAAVRKVETPLGIRYSIRLRKATGREKEIALLRDEQTASNVAGLLSRVVHELNNAARMIAEDRESS